MQTSILHSLGTSRMETDYNPMELSSNTGFEEDSEYKDIEGTDVKDMRLEAEAVVNDVLFAVSNMFVSKNLPCAEDVAYINVETRERNRYCLELTEAGLRVVGYAFDQADDGLQTAYHETVYSLLDSLSPAYREAFGNALLQRLEALKRDGQS
ncbi:GSK3B-interacting protein isoform X2 [Chrysemys picta bellii]|uniref:GSK3B-interacting protein isoform X2 n=1 Tax=Chrysemys picta bellii TaxID=8478 RepID=UPI000388FE78|nr:GSK3B-interacting protein isoform X2 [Chrysemys picta bellii]